MTGDAFRRRHGGWFLEREADVAKANTHQKKLQSRPEEKIRTAFFCPNQGRLTNRFNVHVRSHFREESLAATLAKS